MRPHLGANGPHLGATQANLGATQANLGATRPRVGICLSGLDALISKYKIMSWQCRRGDVPQLKLTNTCFLTPFN